jgi:glycosyltransferase involved in cell wall biosynthesis
MESNKKAPVSLCMIMKNEAPRIEAALNSIKDYVSEIIIIDTGSTDGSPEIAKKYADKFEIFTACNDSEGKLKIFLWRGIEVLNWRLNHGSFGKIWMTKLKVLNI